MRGDRERLGHAGEEDGYAASDADHSNSGNSCREDTAHESLLSAMAAGADPSRLLGKPRKIWVVATMPVRRIECSNMGG